jgi:hypothetical protein
MSAYACSFIINEMVGQFNNFEQAMKASLEGRPTAALGGHEFISLNTARHPFVENIVIANYFYERNISNSFRFRYYEFVKDGSMKIYRPTEGCLENLKKHDYDIRAFLPEIRGALVYMENCDIIWKRILFPRRGFSGELQSKEAIITSATNPSMKLRVSDNLKVYKDEISINDRVYTLDGKLIIGNTFGIPYKLRRVEE